ncbi:MAG: heme exporter protein CcmD [Leptothrix sp. (in: b-proteobacteria)]
MIEYLSMGGHGLYIWGSYVVCALVMLAEPLQVRARAHRARLAAAAPLDEEA